ncbi:MAG: type II toxin-antitoxin system Phd/YefM family antitoxin [Chloroflexi bacterium]|nr:type II toxin-antitoxin system Phd/YefM family antitoxin [Chloroflexota bacterium]
MAESAGRYGNDTDDSSTRRRHVGVAEAKGTFSSLIEGVQHRGESYVIERHGKPAAALVSLDELDSIEAQRRASDEMTGGLRLVGLWGDTPRDVIDELMEHIYAERDRDTGRDVDTSAWPR